MCFKRLWFRFRIKTWDTKSFRQLKVFSPPWCSWNTGKKCFRNCSRHTLRSSASTLPTTTTHPKEVRILPIPTTVSQANSHSQLKARASSQCKNRTLVHSSQNQHSNTWVATLVQSHLKEPTTAIPLLCQQHPNILIITVINNTNTCEIAI